ncbi:TPA: hypothetical protein SMR42_000385 [Pseudomonas putida]|nr:hypothetical protein [Pseudomonas putida]
MSELKVHASACDIEPMVHADEMRKAFVARLKAALAASGIPDRGAGARLAELVKSTPKATSKWLNAESMPRGTNMRTVAEALKVRAEWLEYGVLPMRHGEESLQGSSGNRMGKNHEATAVEHAHGLMAIASPRSQDALAKIIAAAENGALKEDDILLLEQIATKIAGRTDPLSVKNTNAKLREKLASDDPYPAK